MKEKFGKEWVVGKTIEGNVTKATVDGLTEGKQYEFRVRGKFRHPLIANK